jgi:3-hydroxymyristoyl/3-hydroxydecanoyl-(acyl carrier protein) dehydratase
MKDFEFQLVAAASSSNEKVFDFNLPNNLKYFDGHFDGQPILAAVAQLHLVDRLVKSHFEKSLAFSGMKQLKFMSPIVPNEAIRLKVVDKKNYQFAFEFSCNDKLKAKGVIYYVGITDD